MSKINIEKSASLAGTGKEYFGTDKVRVRKCGGGMLRIHFPLNDGHIAVRKSYVRVDIASQEVLLSIKKANDQKLKHY